MIKLLNVHICIHVHVGLSSTTVDLYHQIYFIAPMLTKENCQRIELSLSGTVSAHSPQKRKLNTGRLDQPLY